VAQNNDYLDLWNLSWGSIPAKHYECPTIVGSICAENDVTATKSLITSLAKAMRKRVRSTLSNCKTVDDKLVKGINRRTNQAYRTILQNNDEIPDVVTECAPEVN
jgi:predicted metal-dependent RNase